MNPFGLASATTAARTSALTRSPPFRRALVLRGGAFEVQVQAGEPCDAAFLRWRRDRARCAGTGPRPGCDRHGDERLEHGVAMLLLAYGACSALQRRRATLRRLGALGTVHGGYGLPGVGSGSARPPPLASICPIRLAAKVGISWTRSGRSAFPDLETAHSPSGLRRLRLDSRCGARSLCRRPALAAQHSPAMGFGVCQRLRVASCTTSECRYRGEVGGDGRPNEVDEGSHRQ